MERMINIVMDIISVLVDYLIIVTIADVFTIGIPLLAFARKPKINQFLIEKENFSETQGKCECAGFSSAYVYRHLGMDARGMDIYREIPCKMRKGYVSCWGIVLLALKKGFKVLFRCGNLNALKNAVAKGNPVIVLVHSRVGSRGLHFVPVVGYDEEFIYMMDSARSNRNEVTEHYNRKVSSEEFKKLWNVSMWKQPLYFNLYFEIGKR